MRLSPLTVFWILFYAVAAAGLLVPDRIAKWFAYALATPGLVITAIIGACLLMALSGAVWKFAVTLRRRWKSRA